jgi:integrase
MKVPAYVLGQLQSRRIIVLGSIYEHTLDEAAEWWKAQRRKDREGVDLYEDKQRAKRAIREAKTVSNVIDAFLEEMENSWSVVHAKESRRRLTGPVRDAIGKKIPENVQRSDILNLHRKITERGAPVEANRVRSIVHAMFEYAADYEWVTDGKANPAKMRAKRGHNREQSRARKLNREEVAEVLRAANLVGNHRDGILLRLALLTGLRKSELRCRRWSDVDFQKQTLTVPDMGREVGGTKNRKGPFVLPLSGMAIGLLKNLPRSIDPEGFIFPGKDGKKPLNDWKRPWERIRKESGVKNMTYHDWRRTIASLRA